jgi:RNA polymerase sigma factor (sigma-70 family)
VQHTGPGGVFSGMQRSVDVAAILAHQDFVRRLARGLIADPAAADDLAQDTWLSFLQRPPRAAAAVRSWLDAVLRRRAQNLRRESARRARREAAAARPEGATADGPQERLELQQRVVAAVLALDEPYRKALLLYYYDGLSAAAIGRQLGVPAGTVRSHISRALVRLRARLDDEEQPGGGAWRHSLSLLLDPWLSGAKVALLAGGLLLTLGAAAALAGSQAGASSPGAAVATVAAAATTAAMRDGAASAAAPVSPAATALPAEHDRSPVRPGGEAQDPTAARPIADLQREAAWVQHFLRKRMLTADPDDVGAELAALRGVKDGGTKDVGATRILRREDFEFASNKPLGLNGGGAYFSFATGSHSYDDEPDLELSVGQYESAFYGNMVGCVMQVGDVPLASLTETAPATLGEAQREQWARFWQPAVVNGKVDENWAAGVRGADTRRCNAVLQQTYVLRRVAADEHDVLVAFRPVASDAHGQTIVYRVLRRFFAVDRGRNHMPGAPAGAPPAGLADLQADDLLQRLAAIRAEAEPRLLAVAEADRRAFADLLAQPGTGIARILPRGRFDALVASREGGAYLDFVTQSHAYGGGVHVGLEQGQFGSGFAGDEVGYLLDLGTVPLAAAVQTPADPQMRDATAFLRDLVPERRDGGLHASEADRARARELGLNRRPAALAGHTYLLRNVQQDHTLLVAFTANAVDDDGATLVWRILARQGR